MSQKTGNHTKYDVLIKVKYVSGAEFFNDIVIYASLFLLNVNITVIWSKNLSVLKIIDLSTFTPFDAKTNFTLNNLEGTIEFESERPMQNIYEIGLRTPPFCKIAKCKKQPLPKSSHLKPTVSCKIISLFLHIAKSFQCKNIQGVLHSDLLHQ